MRTLLLLYCWAKWKRNMTYMVFHSPSKFKICIPFPDAHNSEKYIFSLSFTTILWSAHKKVFSNQNANRFLVYLTDFLHFKHIKIIYMSSKNNNPPFLNGESMTGCNKERSIFPTTLICVWFKSVSMNISGPLMTNK